MTEPKVKLLHAPSALSISDVFVEADRIYLLKTGRPATGVLSIQNHEGRVESRFEIYNGQKHGLYEEYFANGDLRYWCRYLHGKQDLYDERYDEHGRLIQSDCWDNGKKHGRCERYELGEISAIQHYRRGKLHGLWETYGPRKVTLFHGHYVDGEPDGWHVWRYSNNQTEAQYRYERGAKTGHWRTFYENGQLMKEFFYENDARIGEERCYYENGVLARVVPYKGGEVEGLCLEYHPNGNLERAIPCIGGVRDGFERYFDDSAKMHREVEWLDGRARSDLSILFEDKTR